MEDVVVQVMVGGQSKKALVFDGTGTTNANFFRASSLRASSWYAPRATCRTIHSRVLTP